MLKNTKPKKQTYTGSPANEQVIPVYYSLRAVTEEMGSQVCSYRIHTKILKSQCLLNPLLRIGRKEYIKHVHNVLVTIWQLFFC